MLKLRHIPKFSFALAKTIASPLLAYFAAVGNGIMFLAAWGFYHFESLENPNVESYWDALWWALCTVSTVGYGDIFPMTGWGRAIGAALIIFGVMFFLSFAAVLASAMAPAAGSRTAS